MPSWPPLKIPGNNFTAYEPSYQLHKIEDVLSAKQAGQNATSQFGRSLSRVITPAF